MTTPVKSIVADATVTEAERSMTTYGVNVLPVVDTKDRYIGMISRETVQKALFHQLGDQPVGDLAGSGHYSASPDTPFHDIETRMIELNQRFVPVLSDGKIVGVITRTDLLRSLHDDDVLASARSKPKSFIGLESPGGVRKRDLKGLLRDRLPPRVHDLLHASGVLAERLGLSLYVVGGFVRDLLLGLENLDVDLVVEGMASRLRAPSRRSVPVASRCMNGLARPWYCCRTGLKSMSQQPVPSTTSIRRPCRLWSKVPSRRIFTGGTSPSIRWRWR